MSKQKTEILIIDDQPGVRKLLEEVLSMEGYSINLASNGTQAMELISSTRPDLVLMDVKMPGINGLELLKVLKEKATQINVIMMTACIEQEIIEEAKKYGVEHYINKPFDLEEVCSILKQVLNESNLMV